MMSIKIICVGKLKEDYLKSAESEYLKRLSRFCKTEIIEVQDEKIPIDKISETDIEKIKSNETNKIIEKISKIGKCAIFVLDLNGKQYSSQEFAEIIDKTTIFDNSTIVFVIGGSIGLSECIEKLNIKKVGFSKMTFPHQLIRIFLLEQIFRTFKILNNENYHH